MLQLHANTPCPLPPLPQLLESITQEVLRQVSLRLPAPARVLDLALREGDKDARLRVLRTALAGGEGDVPGAALWF